MATPIGSQSRYAARLQATLWRRLGKNATASTTSIGGVYAHSLGTTMDGKSFIAVATANLSAVFGVAREAQNDGIVTDMATAGMINSYVLGHAGLSVGDMLIPVNAKCYWAYSAASSGVPAWAIMATAYTNTTVDTLKSIMLAHPL